MWPDFTTAIVTFALRPTRLLLLAVGIGACTYQRLEDSDIEVRDVRLGRTVTLDGVVIHQLSEDPISGADIELMCPETTRRHLKTDANGEFHVRGLPAGGCFVCARSGTDDTAYGFYPRPGQRARMTFRLLPTRVSGGNPCHPVLTLTAGPALVQASVARSPR